MAEELVVGACMASVTETAANGACLLNRHLARTIPWYGVVVLVQRLFFLDTDWLCADWLRWLGEMFFQAFVALAIHLVSNRLPHLH